MLFVIHIIFIKINKKINDNKYIDYLNILSNGNNRYFGG